MRKSGVAQIDDQRFKVNELTVRQIRGIFQGSGEEEADKKRSPLDMIDSFLELAVPELTRDIAMDMAPSELMVIKKKFEEVNSDFLDLVKAAGLDDLVKTEVATAIKEEIKTSSTEPSATSSPQGTDQPSGTTDGASSKKLTNI